MGAGSSERGVKGCSSGLHDRTKGLISEFVAKETREEFTYRNDGSWLYSSNNCSSVDMKGVQ